MEKFPYQVLQKNTKVRLRVFLAELIELVPSDLCPITVLLVTIFYSMRGRLSSEKSAPKGSSIDDVRILELQKTRLCEFSN